MFYHVSKKKLTKEVWYANYTTLRVTEGTNFKYKDTHKNILDTI